MGSHRPLARRGLLFYRLRRGLSERPRGSRGDRTRSPVLAAGTGGALRTAVAERPERYPAGVVALIRQRRAATLRQGVHFALRLGRFGEGAAFARRACAFDRSPRGIVLVAVARLLATRAGSATFRF